MKQIFFIGIFGLLQATKGSFVSPRISGGQNATKGQFPYQVVLVERQSRDGQYLYRPFCGGSLIHPSFILTAAHCVIRKRDLGFTVFGGIVSLVDPVRVVGEPFKLAVHEKYEKKRNANDIAIIKLRRPMFGLGVRTVQLPPTGSEPRTGNYSVIAGFGRILPDIRSSSLSVLAFTTMEILKPNFCPSSNFRQNIHICSRGVTQRCGTCAGDSGGPLVDPANHTLLGLVSYGIGQCSSPTKRTVFTKVSAYIPWIERNMKLL